MTEKTEHFAIDRVEGTGAGKVAIVEGTSGNAEVPVSEFAFNVHEGMVLRVTITPAGPDWSSSRQDHAEEERRRGIAGKILKSLPIAGSGDISI